MSYTSSDPENIHRDPDTTSLASTSTTGASVGQQSTKKKKPWSKFKSSIKSIGEKMSSKPKFTEPTESSEQKRVKKSKKFKASSSGEQKSTSPEEAPRAKSPTKSLIKKLSVETISTPFVGYQPSSVSPVPKSYAKAFQKSGSTSESNLSTSDIDTPKKSLTLDRNTKYNLSAQNSPDSGRVSQNMGSTEDSRPPSQIKEETSDVSIDSDYTGSRHGGSVEEDALDNLVAKTEQFAQSLVSPKPDKERDVDVSVEFLKAEIVVMNPNSLSDVPSKPGGETKKETKLDSTKENVGGFPKPESDTKIETKLDSTKGSSQNLNKQKSDLDLDTQKVEILAPDKDKPDGRRKKNIDTGSKKDKASSSELIKSEQTKSSSNDPAHSEDNSVNNKTPEPTTKHETPKENPNTESKQEINKEKERNHDSKDRKSRKESTKDGEAKSEKKLVHEIKPNISSNENAKTTSDTKLNKTETESAHKTKLENSDKTPKTKQEDQLPTVDAATKKGELNPETKPNKSANEKEKTTSDTKLEKTGTESLPETKLEKSDKNPKTKEEEKPPAVDDTAKKGETKLVPEIKPDKFANENAKTTSDTKLDKVETELVPDVKLETPDKTPETKQEDNLPAVDDTAEKGEPKPNTASRRHRHNTEKAASSKSTAKSLDVGLPSPLTDVDPLTPQASMSVEEKLQAFLSAEGWSGTVTDVSVKSSSDGSQQPDKRECLYKILVIGELGTGKTSIIKRYVHQFFSQHYRATIGVDFALKVINWDPNTIIRLQLWDIAGQERFGNMTRVYYKEAVGAFIVFDVTRSATFDAVLKWKQDLDSKVQLADGSPIPCVLLANKCDQQKEGIVNTPSKMDEYCKENNFSAWFETSAKENINIDEAAKSLVTQILQNDKTSQNGRDSARDGGKFPLDGKSEQESKSCAC